MGTAYEFEGLVPDRLQWAFMPPDSKQRDPEWIARRHARERQKLLGLLALALFILVLAFVRFGRTIPWGAR